MIGNVYATMEGKDEGEESLQDSLAGRRLATSSASVIDSDFLTEQSATDVVLFQCIHYFFVHGGEFED